MIAAIDPAGDFQTILSFKSKLSVGTVASSSAMFICQKLKSEWGVGVS